MAKPASQPAGRAAFYNDFPVNRTRDVVGTVPTPLGWIPMGRDTNLEQCILAGSAMHCCSERQRRSRTLGK